MRLISFRIVIIATTLVLALSPLTISSPAEWSSSAPVKVQTADAQTGATRTKIKTVVEALVKSWPRFKNFIQSNVKSLLNQGSLATQRSYTSIVKQITLHEAKLRTAEATARRSPTQYNKGLVSYYQKELLDSGGV